MELGFLALIIIILIAPGFIFRYAFLSPPFSLSEWLNRDAVSVLEHDQSAIATTSTFSKSFILALFLSPIIHYIYFHIASFIYCLVSTSRINIDIKLWISLIYGTDTNEHIALLSNNLEHYHHHIFWYFISLMLFAVILGSITNSLVNELGIAKRFGWLGWRYDWPNIFDADELASKDEEVLIVATLSVEYSDSTYLYLGILDDYRLYPDGRLHSVTLLYSKRRKLSNDRKTKEHIFFGKSAGQTETYSLIKDEEVEHDGSYKTIKPAGTNHKNINLTTRISNTTESPAVSHIPILSGEDDRYNSIDGDYTIIVCDKVQSINIDYIYIEYIERETSHNPPPRTK